MDLEPIKENTLLPGNILPDIEIKNMDGLLYLKSIPDKSIDLILTDPPYIISKKSGMDSHYQFVKNLESNNI